MLAWSAVGAAIAGVYGALHDQLSYTISPEYFTRFKFDQFAWADMGLPPRGFAAVVGCLASWWVGLFAAWFIARMRIPRPPVETVRRDLIIAISLVFGLAILGGASGLGFGHLIATHTDLADWEDWQRYAGVRDLPNFARVGWLHNGSYLGAILGIMTALAWVRWKKSPAP